MLNHPEIFKLVIHVHMYSYCTNYNNYYIIKGPVSASDKSSVNIIIIYYYYSLRVYKFSKYHYEVFKSINGASQQQIPMIINNKPSTMFIHCFLYGLAIRKKDPRKIWKHPVMNHFEIPVFKGLRAITVKNSPTKASLSNM